MRSSRPCQRAGRDARLPRRRPNLQASEVPMRAPVRTAARTSGALQPWDVMRTAPNSVMVSPGNGGNTYSTSAAPASTPSPVRLSCSEINAMNQSPSDSTIPPRLRAGDKVAVVAPSGPVPEDRLRAGLAVLAGRYRVQIADDALRTDG